jgi:four helix bundle protein
MATTFKELDVYTRAAALADELYETVTRWPKFELWTMGIQLLRAIDSVCANIAEATGRWHTPDRRRLLFIARGSLAETEHWLLCGEERGLLPAGYNERLSDIRRPLNGLIKKAPPD